MPCTLRGRALELVRETASETRVYEVRMWAADPGVPVLYFTVYRHDAGGTRVAGLPELALPEASVCEHPETGLPTLFIHPCNTRAWLTDTRASMLLWLVHFGAQAGLDLRAP